MAAMLGQKSAAGSQIESCITDLKSILASKHRSINGTKTQTLTKQRNHKNLKSLTDAVTQSNIQNAAEKCRNLAAMTRNFKAETHQQESEALVGHSTRPSNKSGPVPMESNQK